jgi:hypothetical protein
MESVPLLDCVGRRRSPATLFSFTNAVRRVTMGCGIRLIRRPWRRSSQPCSPLVTMLRG